MGRKTWESIPPRFRPLKDRVNVLISRQKKGYSKVSIEQGKEVYYEAESLGASIEGLESYQSTGDGQYTIEKIFIIGGGQIYKAALRLTGVKRILFTRILDDFKCDTFFPLNLRDDGQGEQGWSRMEKEDLDRWVGENIPVGEQLEGERGTRYIFEMWER